MEKTTQTPEDQGKDPFVAGIPMEEEDTEVKGEDKTPEIKKEEPKKELPDSPKDGEQKATPPVEDKPKADPTAITKDKENDAGEDKKSPRPERYIPVKKYTEEKKVLNETIAQKEARIAELETIVGGGKDKTDQAVKEYAEKHDVSEESVRDLLGLLGGSKDKVSDDTKKEIPPEVLAEVEEARELKAEKLFDEEFNTLGMSQLKELFPEATPEQLKEAKEELRKAALTEEYIDKSLDYIAYKERAELADIFKAKNKGLESGRRSADTSTKPTVEDFKNGADFNLLNDLSQEERDAIVKEFPLDVWAKYKRFVNANDDLIINP